jgi:hypothetical protein
MSLNRSVRFGPSLAEIHRHPQMGRIMHLGYMSPLEPVITTPEGIGLGIGSALLVAGAVMKKKPGLILMILGGAGALYGIGSAIYRAISKPPGVPVAVKPGISPGQALVTQLAPSATTLISKLFPSSSTPAAPTPASSSPWGPGGPPVTSIPGLPSTSQVVTTQPVMVTSLPAPAPAPDTSSSDGGFVTSLDDGVAGIGRRW